MDEIENTEVDDLGTDGDGGQDDGSEQTLRDSLEEAIIEVDGSDDDGSGSGDAGSGDGDAGSGDGDGAAVGAADGKQEEADKGKDDLGAATDSDGRMKPDGKNGESYKAPISSTPKEREDWSKLPLDAQRQIREREASFDKLMKESSTSRQVMGQMNQLATSYAPIFAAEGAKDFKSGVKGMLDTISMLQTGSPQNKAIKMAKLISHYGIDFGMLDSALAGEEVKDSPASEVQQMIDNSMRPINELMQNQSNIRQQNINDTQQKAIAEVNSFTGEFLSDVREQMADIIDMRAARGEMTTLDEAYNMAVSMNPEIQGVLKQRADDEAITGNKVNVRNKLNAASSVRGNKGGDGSGGAMSMRQTIEDAWDE